MKELEALKQEYTAFKGKMEKDVSEKAGKIAALEKEIAELKATIQCL